MNKRNFIATAAVVCCAVVATGCNPAPQKVTYTPEYDLTTEFASATANDKSYYAESVKLKTDSPLAGKTVYWLGSSVTDGAASGSESMADFLAARTGCKSVKEAVSGTTLYDDGGSGDSGAKSYTRRLITGTNFDKTERVDAFICQISTNDARNDRLGYWGKMLSDEYVDKDDFNRKTTLGGVEYIISYVVETWNCPVYFYSGGWFGDSGNRKNANPTGTNYGRLVDEVKKIVEKWQALSYDVDIIDLYNDEEFNNAVTDEYYAWAMSDAIHPKRAGYLEWWTPYFEAFLSNKLQ